ncbi:hypothetical protein DVH24_013045 [Malus domestica]|uniref:Uncharacterized protein n=1 Tax=Malus domestica TaxID=3750 RepID=A0A498HW14_MALDO|nr:hypothetical protein DVH24_013045 [Malus domestica]
MEHNSRSSAPPPAKTKIGENEKGLGLGGAGREDEEICRWGWMAKLGKTKRGWVLAEQMEKKKKFLVGTKKEEEEICRWGWIEKLGKAKRGWFWQEQGGDEEEDKKTQGAMRDGKERAEEVKLPDQ